MTLPVFDTVSVYKLTVQGQNDLKEVVVPSLSSPPMGCLRSLYMTMYKRKSTHVKCLSFIVLTHKNQKGFLLVLRSLYQKSSKWTEFSSDFFFLKV
jgi:hypothetical protein